MSDEEALKILMEHGQYHIPIRDLPALEIAMDALRTQIKFSKDCAKLMEDMTIEVYNKCSE